MYKAWHQGWRAKVALRCARYMRNCLHAGATERTAPARANAQSAGQMIRFLAELCYYYRYQDDAATLEASTACRLTNEAIEGDS
eukprot:1078375-Pleurochrysis_carterae.AAC.1